MRKRTSGFHQPPSGGSATSFSEFPGRAYSFTHEILSAAVPAIGAIPATYLFVVSIDVFFVPEIGSQRFGQRIDCQLILHEPFVFASSQHRNHITVPTADLADSADD